MAEALLSETEEPKVAPTSLRERNKQKKRVAIFDATRELLQGELYARMTMEAIAERAEVSVATVYKYFGTKDGLVIELVRGDMEEMLEEVGKIVADPPANLSDAMIALLERPNSMQVAKGQPRLVQHIFDKMWYQKGDLLNEFARWMTDRMKASIEALLADFQGRGMLERSLNTAALARIIYTLLDYNYIIFARGDFVSLEEMAELTNKQVRLLLDNWST